LSNNILSSKLRLIEHTTAVAIAWQDNPIAVGDEGEPKDHAGDGL
jgi:hypothetical protein